MPVGHQPPPALPPEALATLRHLVLLVLIAGLVLLSAAFAVRLTGVMGDPPELLRATPLAVAVAVGEWVAYLFLPGFLESVGRERIARDGEQPRRLAPVRERLVELLSGSRIMSLLLMGGASLFLIVGYTLEGSWMVLPPLAVSLTAVAMTYPRAEAVEDWMAEQLRLIEIERQRQWEE